MVELPVFDEKEDSDNQLRKKSHESKDEDKVSDGSERFKNLLTAENVAENVAEAEPPKIDGESL